jgi:hypothetical protein
VYYENLPCSPRRREDEAVGLGADNTAAFRTSRYGLLERTLEAVHDLYSSIGSVSDVDEAVSLVDVPVVESSLSVLRHGHVAFEFKNHVPLSACEDIVLIMPRQGTRKAI